MIKGYVLNGREIVETDFMSAVFCQSDMEADGVDWRRIALTEVAGLAVSTVFLGVDMACGQAATPVLFETMIGSDYGFEGFQCRYCTYDEVEAGHARVVAALTQCIAQDGNLDHFYERIDDVDIDRRE